MHATFQPIVDAISERVIGKQGQIKLALTCLLANGHLLLEDLPGMGKTTLSHALANVFGLDFSRVQFTSDLLPADLLGVNILNSAEHKFEFRSGPIFNQLVLADEINRASPKTQSALLEAMEERQVSIDGETYALPKPFFVIGTQNPSHQAGTYPLPESQLDRFMMKISLGYPSWEAEKQMLQQAHSAQLPPVSKLLDLHQLEQAQRAIVDVHVSDAVLEYVLRLVTRSRDQQMFAHALSPRASKSLLNAAKAWAFIHDRDYVTPDHVQAILPAVAEHRLRASSMGDHESKALSEQLLASVDPLAA